MMKTTPLLCLWLAMISAVSPVTYSQHSASSTAKPSHDLPANNPMNAQDTTPPHHIVATAGDGYVELRWASNATKHRVHYAKASFDDITADHYEPLGESQYRSVFVPSGNRVVVNNLTNGTRYYFVVTAKRDNIQSHASYEISITPMVKPPT